MQTEIIFPDYGKNMTDGKLINWYKDEGSHVRKGEALYQVSFSSGSVNCLATASGYLISQNVSVGDTVSSGDVIGIISDSPEEKITEALQEADSFHEDGSIDEDAADNLNASIDDSKEETMTEENLSTFDSTSVDSDKKISEEKINTSDDIAAEDAFVKKIIADDSTTEPVEAPKKSETSQNVDSSSLRNLKSVERKKYLHRKNPFAATPAARFYAKQMGISDNEIRTLKHGSIIRKKDIEHFIEQKRIFEKVQKERELAQQRENNISYTPLMEEPSETVEPKSETVSDEDKSNTVSDQPESGTRVDFSESDLSEDINEQPVHQNDDEKHWDVVKKSKPKKRHQGKKATPIARAMAESYNLDLEQIEGTGRKGEIVRNDVIKAIVRQKNEADSSLAGNKTDNSSISVHETQQEKQSEIEMTQNLSDYNPDAVKNFIDKYGAFIQSEAGHTVTPKIIVAKAAANLLKKNGFSSDIAFLFNENQKTYQTPVFKGAAELTLSELTRKYYDAIQGVRCNRFYQKDFYGAKFIVADQTNDLTNITKGIDILLLNDSENHADLSISNGSGNLPSDFLKQLTEQLSSIEKIEAIIGGGIDD